MNPRLLIALHSPSVLCETGLRVGPPENRRDSDPVLSRAVRSLQSGLLRNYREQWASFAYFGENNGGVSLQLRLAGGEGGIRTLGTGISPYNGLANRRIRPLCHLSGVRIFSLPCLLRVTVCCARPACLPWVCLKIALAAQFIAGARLLLRCRENVTKLVAAASLFPDAL